MSDNGKNGQEHTAAQLTVEQHINDVVTTALKGWDEAGFIKGMLKQYAKKGCPRCEGQGYRSLEMRPMFRPSPIAKNGSLLVCHYPVFVPCTCVDWDGNEHKRLHDMNVNASHIALANKKLLNHLVGEIELIRQGVADLCRMSPSYYLLMGYRWTKMNLQALWRRLGKRFRSGRSVIPPRTPDTTAQAPQPQGSPTPERASL